jgi:kelch-like protein 10
MFCHELERKAHKYLMKNFVEVALSSEELLELTPQQAINVFGSDELNVKSEELVWDAILRWITHSPEDRKEHIVELILQVRTGLMETQYFMEHVKDHPFVHGNEGCRPIVIETLRFLYDLEVVNTREVQLHVRIKTESW